MENPTKRQMQHASQPQDINPDVASLATLGMRIRKAVADGYALRENANLSYDPQYFTRQQYNRPAIERVPLPQGVSEPPSLTNEGSTFQSGLNVSEWGAPTNISTLPFSYGTKRRYDDDMSGFEKSSLQPQVVVQLPTYEEFRASNGQLNFNEEF